MDLIMEDAINGNLGGRKKYSGPIGEHTFKKTTTGLLGDGHESLIDFSTFSPLFNEIRRHNMEMCEMGVRFPDWASPSTWNVKKRAELKKLKIDAGKLAAYARLAIERIRQDTMAPYKFAEWHGETNFTTGPPKTALEWAKATRRRSP